MPSLETKELLLASHNEGKVREFSALIQPFGINLRSSAELGLSEPAETGSTFEQNAYIKAHAAARASNMVALADDSGLCIEALNGKPGIHTADWAITKEGKRDFAAAMARIENELRQKGAVAPDRRKCHFVCVLCLAWPDGQGRYFRGEVEGQIRYPPSGGCGFGYDPVFQPLGHDRTFADMTEEQKHGWKRGEARPLSHRARAFRLFAEEMLKA